MGRNIVIAINNKPAAERAFKFYVSAIHQPDHEVILLHVYDSVTVPATYYITENLNEEDLIREAREIQTANIALEEKYCAMCIAANIKHTTLSLPRGDDSVGAVIVENVTKLNASMVIVGSRGLGKFRRAFVGSVSDYVLHHTPVPIFICPESD